MLTTQGFPSNFILLNTFHRRFIPARAIIYRILWHFQLLNSCLQQDPQQISEVSAVPKIVIKPTLLVFCHCEKTQSPTAWATAFNFLDENRMSYVNIALDVPNPSSVLLTHNSDDLFSTNLSIVWRITKVILASAGKWLLNCLMDFHQDMNFAGVKATACLASAGSINPKAELVQSPLSTFCARACAPFWFLRLGNKAMLVLAWFTVLSSQSKPNFALSG